MKILSPADRQLPELCRLLAEQAQQLDGSGDWPEEQLRLCAEYGVYEWFLDATYGGQAWTDLDVVKGYLALSAACLTTTFVLTQRTGACRRIAGSENQQLKAELLPLLARGESFATVGISHLTTSRQHVARPVLTAQATSSGWRLDGYSPWVTGASRADHVVVGATLCEGRVVTSRQLLFAIPTSLAGVHAETPLNLVALSGSLTGALRLEAVEVDDHYRLAGPVENIMASGSGASTGGYETSTLAVGLSTAAIQFLVTQAEHRPTLLPPLHALQTERDQLESLLYDALLGAAHVSREQLRQQANSLALRSTQAALSAAKGTGYVIPHPTGRWCKEALFFLVWSCPQAVVDANLCQLAGIDA